MSSLKRNLFLSVFGAAMSATVAFAADLPTPPVIEYEPETTVEIGSNWYLRGDLGYAIHRVGDVYWMDPANGRRDFYDKSLAGSVVADIGAGVYVSERFRLDATLGIRHISKFKGKIACIGTCGSPYSTESNDITALTGFLNAYYDFAKFDAATFYAGAGVGFSHLKTSKYRTSSGSNFKGGDNTNFAWNLMAGVAYDLDENIKLDAGYRFVSLGHAKTSSTYTTGASATNPVKFRDIYAHDFRLGLRYDLN